MTLATDRQIHAADMERHEAEELTQLIKNNFDSLGSMLIQARDRKAYKALGYRSFEAYCQTEFGKPISSAYRLIENAKIISQLEKRISQNYGEEITLKLPASHLEPLKAIDSIDDRLKAIEYAQNLAAAENRKATKKDLKIAAFKISGKRSEDFRSAIQSLGFTKGIQVEVRQTLKKDNRGFVTKIDKGGKIYVEFYYRGNVPVPFDAADLRILEDAEKPANPASDDTLSKGDRVKIFAKGLEGKTGELYIWKSGKIASVIVEDATLPIDIAYAELELIQGQKKHVNWESEFVWNSRKNTYYYLPQENKIYSDMWPTSLKLEPHTHLESPQEFMEKWENDFSYRILESLATPSTLKTLAIAQAIELPEVEAKEFISDLITSLRQLFWDEIPYPSALLEENKRLREQLVEAESVIQAMINVASPSAPGTDFLLENTTEISNPGGDASGTNFLLENAAQISSPGGDAPGTHFLLENAAEISSPGGDAPETDFLLENTSPTDSTLVSTQTAVFLDSWSPEILEQLQKERDKADNRLEQNRKKLYDLHGNHGHKLNKKEIHKLEQKIDDDYAKLKQLELVSLFRVGQTICHKRDPITLGKIINLQFSRGGMPLVWVKYFKDGELEATPTSELVSMIFVVDI